jgi:hypothetical protein
MIRYNINSGVEKIKSKYRKYAVSAGAGILIAGAAAVPALAAGHSDASNASACGAAHAAQADVNGNFGFLGEVGGTPGYHNGATGQDAGATGFNNSHTNCQG